MYFGNWHWNAVGRRQKQIKDDFRYLSAGCLIHSITSIQTKSFVGGIEKSFLYDSIAKSAKREDQVDYVQRQAHKIQQKPQEGGGKLRFVLTDKELATINRILDSNFVSIEIVRHKFFSGTWATNILFQNENSFCEYNSGSGEFLVATIVREIEKASNNSIVLIDEPEVSLHPRAQYKLIEYFLDAIKRKHIQMIATTHSEHIVEMLPNLADARDSKEKLFRIANALSLPIGGIEQLLITQFIIKKGEDYQKISELLHMIAEQH